MCLQHTSLNSSTRCELGAAILAMLAPNPLIIGIDNATVVKKGNEIVERLRKKQEHDSECLEEQEGGEREVGPGRKEGGERHTAAAAAVETVRLDY